MIPSEIVVAALTLAGTLAGGALIYRVNRRTAATGEGQLSLAGLQQQITNATARAQAAETRSDADRQRMDALWADVAELQRSQRQDARRIAQLEDVIRQAGMQVPPPIEEDT